MKEYTQDYERQHWFEATYNREDTYNMELQVAVVQCMREGLDAHATAMKLEKRFGIFAVMRMYGTVERGETRRKRKSLTKHPKCAEIKTKAQMEKYKKQLAT